MTNTQRILFLVLTVLFITQPIPLAAADQIDTKSVASDPLLWQPTKPDLEVKPVLDDVDYEARKQNVLQNIHKEGIDNKNYPLSGLLLDSVAPQGRADINGFRPGDIITAINGNPPSDELLSKTVKGSNDFTLTICRIGSPPRDVKFPPGRIGVGDIWYVDLTRTYWANGPRDNRWDDDVLVATRQCSIDTNLALTAIAHAHDAGCDGPFFQAVLCETEYSAGHYEKALNLGLPILRQLSDAVRPIVVQILYSAAQLSYHWNVMEKLITDYPHDIIDMAQENFIALIAEHRALPPELRISRPPAEIASEATFLDLTDDIEHIDGLTIETWGVNGEESLPTTPFDNIAWKRDHKIALTAMNTKITMVDVGPPLQNAEISAEFTCRDHDKTPVDPTEKQFAVGLIAYRPLEKQGRIVFMAGLNPAGELQIMTRTGVNWVPRKFSNPALTKHCVRVIVVGARVEVLIDNERVYDGLLHMINRQDQLLGLLYAQNVDVQITDMEWRKLNVAVPSTQPK